MGDWGPASNVYRHLLWISSIIIIILSSKELLHFVVKAPGSPHNFSYSFRDRQRGHVMIDMTVVLRNVGQCSYYYCILNILSDWLRANLYKSENCGNMKRSADIL